MEQGMKGSGTVRVGRVVVQEVGARLSGTQQEYLDLQGRPRGRGSAGGRLLAAVREGRRRGK